MGRGQTTTRYFAVAVVILSILAAAGFGLYFTSGPKTLTTLRTVTHVPTFSTTAFPGPLVIVPNATTVDMNLDFTPRSMTVVIGVNNTATWLNEDTYGFHTVTLDSGPQGVQYFSGIAVTGGTFTVTFTKPGTYMYYCEWHPAWMRATIIVKSA